MKALMWTDKEEMNVVQIEPPQPAEGEVLIRVHTVGICGSDLEGYLGHNSLRVPPLLMGHEVSGVVEQLGERVQHIQVGDRVVINPLIACGRCLSCYRGQGNVCPNRQIIGIHRPGGYAQYVTAPESNVYVIPDGLPFKTASLVEPLACALRATRRAMASIPIPNVVVIGTGTLGVLSAFVAKILGASKVVLIDKNEKRVKHMQQLPFDHVLLSDDQVESRIKDAIGPRGVDVVIDAAGFQPTRELAVRLVNSGGVVMNIGLGIDDTTIPINHIIRQEIDIKGSFCYSNQDFVDAIELLASGKVNEDGWSTTEPLERGNECFRALTKGEIAHAKIFLQP